MLECIGIGSLPHINPRDAVSLVQDNFKEIPFWPQLVNYNKNESMLIQFLGDTSSFFLSENNNKIWEENFLHDYDKILSGDIDLLEKYAIKDNFSVCLKDFFSIIKNNKFAKGQIIGPYTLSQLTKSINKQSLITKLLSLKAIWQIELFKKQRVTPIIFIDEPLLNQVTNKEETIINIKKISDLIKKYGGISGLHCCSKCDWTIPISANIDIINPDVYTYSENILIYNKEISDFISKGGKIAWGIVPTKEIIKNETSNSLIQKLYETINYLTKTGINEKLILSNSYITQSCGCGSLSIELTKKVMQLTKEISDILKERYNDNKTCNYR